MKEWDARAISIFLLPIHSSNLWHELFCTTHSNEMTPNKHFCQMQWKCYRHHLSNHGADHSLSVKTVLITVLVSFLGSPDFWNVDATVFSYSFCLYFLSLDNLIFTNLHIQPHSLFWILDMGYSDVYHLNSFCTSHIKHISNGITFSPNLHLATRLYNDWHHLKDTRKSARLLSFSLSPYNHVYWQFYHPQFSCLRPLFPIPTLIIIVQDLKTSPLGKSIASWMVFLPLSSNSFN